MHIGQEQFCTDWALEMQEQLTGWQEVSWGVETYVWWQILRKQQKLFFLGSCCPKSTRGMKRKQLASSCSVTKFCKAQSCELGKSASRLCSCLYRWGLFPDWQLRFELGNSVERAYELRRRECREPNTWSFTPLGNAFEIHVTHGVLNKPGNDI